MRVRDGCILIFSDLFNFYSDAIERELQTLSGFIISGHTFNNIQYENDIILVAHLERELLNILARVVNKKRTIYCKEID